jgi:hypothetical protein
VYPNLYFWFTNIPSGNTGQRRSYFTKHFTGKQSFTVLTSCAGYCQPYYIVERRPKVVELETEQKVLYMYLPTNKQAKGETTQKESLPWKFFDGFYPKCFNNLWLLCNTKESHCHNLEFSATAALSINRLAGWLATIDWHQRHETRNTPHFKRKRSLYSTQGDQMSLYKSRPKT